MGRKNFDERYDAVLDVITEGIYELAETFAEEQLENFVKWLDKQGQYTDPDWVKEFIAEQNS